jgi:UDP-3-O-[3-hydroxymyristoyl] N-acetylglucosamine deacetylase
MVLYSKFQNTLASPFDFSGVGVHSGLIANVRVSPAEPDSGIIFRRSDHEGHSGIRVSPQMVRQTMLCTLLTDNTIQISTIEHLMSALWGMGVDNAIVEIDGEEMPIMDGSAAPFCDMISRVALKPQDAKRRYLTVTQEFKFTDGDKYVLFAPSDHIVMRYEVEFDNPGIGRQVASWQGEGYAEQVAGARTYGFVKDLNRLRAMGLARGGSLENAIGVDEDGAILNPEGLRYPNEFALHKMLDLIGDLFLENRRIIGRIEAYKASHSIHNAALNALLESDAFTDIIY